MQLTDAQIAQFQSLYKKRFSIGLSEDQAKEKGLKLIAFIEAVYKPKPPSKKRSSE